MGCGGKHWDLGVPPPCPVDDTPYTACTPESVALATARAIAAATGRTLPPGTVTAVMVKPPLGVPSQPVTTVVQQTFTTKTYRGKRPKPLKKLP